jgi:hypothetical protein
LRQLNQRRKFSLDLRIGNFVISLFALVVNLLSREIEFLTTRVGISLEFLPYLPVAVFAAHDRKLVFDDSLPCKMIDVVIRAADRGAKTILLASSGKLVRKGEVIGPAEGLRGHLEQPIGEGYGAERGAAIRYPPLILELIEKPNSIASIAGPDGISI